MEALVRHRRRVSSTNDLAMAWGSIGRTGYVARNNLTDTLFAMGVAPVAPEHALATLAVFIGENREHGVHGRFDWNRLRTLAPTMVAPRFAPVRPPTDPTGRQPLSGFLHRLTTAEDPEQAARLVEDLMATMIAGVLRMPAEDIDRHRPLQQYGMDSLMGMELVTALRRRLDQEVPVMELLHSDGSVSGVAEAVLPHLLRRASAGAPPGRENP
ncbi:beta-ketoacyl reductase [Streptomyces sp. CA-181903]|uniref:acyl carrier protein n=1 Tax=Streptomyces sp. CA-181903 TaxID=3240055 RepID=UPI003D91EBB6